MLAQIRAGIMNSIPETVVTLHIDEKDPDPKKTIQIANVLALQSRNNNALLVGTSNVQTIEDRVNQSNIRLAIESDNPKVPQISQDVTRNTADIPTPDSETGETLAKLTTTGFGFTPQMVDNSYEADYAASVVQGNFLNNLTSFQRQERFNPQITNLVRSIVKASPRLMKDVESKIRNNFDLIMENINEASGDKIDPKSLNKDSLEVIIKYLVDKFTDGLEVTLPAPTNDNNEAKVEQLSRYEERIDKAISYIISDDVLPSEVVGEEASAFIRKYGAIVKAHMMRQWMIDNDYLSDIMDFFSVTDNNVQTYEKNQDIRDLAIKAVKATMEFFKESKNIADSTDGVAKGNGLSADDSGSDYSSDDSNSSDDGGDSDGFDDGFGDDFGGGDEGDEGGDTEDGGANPDGSGADGPSDQEPSW